MNKYTKPKKFDTTAFWMCDLCEHYYTGACDGSNELVLMKGEKQEGVPYAPDLECKNYEQCRGVKLSEKLDNLWLICRQKNESDNRFFFATCCWNVSVAIFIVLYMLGYV